MHLLAIAALLGVGALLIVSLDSDPSRGSGRGEGVQSQRGDGPREGEAKKSANRSARRPDGEFGAVILVRAEGKPVADARVVLTGPRVWRGTTDKQGRADAGWLTPGRYAAQAREGSRAAARVFDLTREDREITLELGSTIAVTGTVRAADGTPIAGARIEAEAGAERASTDGKWRRSWIQAGAYPPIFAEAQSDESGAYELLLPKAGRYGLRVGAAGFSGAGERDRDYDAPATGVDFFLQPGAAVDGVVKNEEGAAVAGALVAVASNNRSSGGPYTALATTDAEGRFALTAGIGGWTNMTVRATGYATRIVGVIRPPSRAMNVVLRRGLVVRARFVILDSGGQPAAGVEAMLSTGGGAHTAMSDHEGRVEFAQVNDGAMSPRGRAFRQLSAGGGGFVPVQKPISQQQVIDGVIDAGEIELVRGATVRGRVTDATSGDPVAGAKVKYWSMTSMRFSMMPLSATTSDAQGRYELTGVPNDTVAMLAAHDDYAPAMDRRALFMKARDPQNRLLAPGQLLLDHDVELSPAAFIDGRVVNGAGDPVAGALVTGPLDGGSTADAVTNAEGRFRLTGFAPDARVPLRARHGIHGASKQITVKVGGGDEPTLELVAPVRLAGLVIDEAGDPIVHARVSAMAQATSRRSWSQEVSSGVTDKSGRYFLRDVPPQDLELRIDHPGYAVARQTITVPANDAEYDAGSVTLDRGVGISGRVTDADGLGLAGINVSIAYAWKKGARRQAGGTERTMYSVASGADGKFEVWGVKQGNFRVSASVPGRYATSVVTASGSRDVVVVVKEAARIRGRVMGDGKPVGAAWVRASQPGAGQGRARWIATANTAPDGTFELGPLPPGAPFDISITHNEFRTLSRKSVTAASAPAEFVLESGLVVQGTVVDSEGNGIANAGLRVSRGKINKWTRTDEQGGFKLGGLEEGSYTVSLNTTPPQFVRGDPIQTEAGGEPIRFVLVTGGSIRGKLVPSEPDSLGTVVITAIDHEGKTRATAWVWPSGGFSFTLRGLPPGRYTIKVVQGWGASAKLLEEITGIETGEENLEIRIRG